MFLNVIAKRLHNDVCVFDGKIGKFMSVECVAAQFVSLPRGTMLTYKPVSGSKNYTLQAHDC